jgi:hypothetical protein
VLLGGTGREVDAHEQPYQGGAVVGEQPRPVGERNHHEAVARGLRPRDGHERREGGGGFGVEAERGGGGGLRGVVAFGHVGGCITPRDRLATNGDTRDTREHFAPRDGYAGVRVGDRAGVGRSTLGGDAPPLAPEQP